MSQPSATGRIEVRARPERVYELISEPGTLAELADEYATFRWLDGAFSARVGARFKGGNRRGLRRWSTIATVTDAVAGRCFAFEVSAGPAPVARWQYDIEPVAGGCRVTESTWERRPGWLKFAGSLASGVWDRAEHNRHNIANTLRRLKARAEAN
ncbi:SRPBCC family protein [Amycolatopsis cihanbeyliensis]|uniref:Polyketide cyclase/dehydrase/lipid transport protein n=1 Tax=Amycolatopsis cihanbeyliensis TaxID=1128664 RepID=A0A542DL09_AMYCI|nr:SRPBCC family protein [Amycolatopsis cihanbeyliensis]TQJ03714.1 polyketide cyclase/dehydrase/lipid transport protein [Amycolatopsis cihanbeyliensis]